MTTDENPCADIIAARDAIENELREKHAADLEVFKSGAEAQAQVVAELRRENGELLAGLREVIAAAKAERKAARDIQISYTNAAYDQYDHAQFAFDALVARLAPLVQVDEVAARVSENNKEVE